ncbi:MAG: hypothetical protein C5B48_02780 [Candidatus Rokuibacteriota bacterium]|nr:MAG: hypothetical protein C5B48_02780 [Candidatus Rokubacteria bacterium]
MRAVMPVALPEVLRHGKQTGGFAVVQANASTPDRWDRDYRIPDVAVMTRDARPEPGAVYVLPTVVFEVRSPEDETFEKLAFYAAVGIRAVVVVERDTKAVQVFSRAGDRFVLEPPNPDGWLTISALEVEVRSDSTSGVARLTLRLAREPESVRIF